MAFAAWFGGRGLAVIALFAIALAFAFFLLKLGYSFVVDLYVYKVGSVICTFVCIVTIALFDSLNRTKGRLEKRFLLVRKRKRSWRSEKSYCGRLWRVSEMRCSRLIQTKR